MKIWKFDIRITPLAQLLVAIGMALILTRFPAHYLEFSLYDARVRLSKLPEHGDEIVLIPIDRKTLDLYGRAPEFSDYTQMLGQIASENPQSVVVVQDPLKWKGRFTDKMEFAELAGKVPNFFFGANALIPLSQHATLLLPPPLDGLIQAEMPTTRDTSSFAQDRVTRRVIISYENRFMLQPILANHFNHVIKADDYRGIFEYEDSKQAYIRFHKKGSFPRLSFADVAQGRFPQRYFAGKIVLIGSDSELETEDYTFTPLSRDVLAMSKLEAQANAIATLIHNNAPVRAPVWLDIFFTAIVAFVTLVAVWNFRPVKCIAALIVTALCIFVIGWVLYATAGLWINMVHPLLSIFVCYYFFIPYRLILENKMSWEYYQKNKLLTQVEELKTNFLSMMSHDLKTPIARIQGMAETALADHKGLSGNQKEALGSIIQSSEELGTFISSILDLSRIESKEVKLRKTSKDINAILKEVIRKYEFVARAKNISLVPKFEPLFSVPVDADLIRQVFSNLIENAIKYSPENTNVVIASAEIGGKIQVSVQDQGPGIPKDEVENIFLKFYRSKSAKASPIKGSGLGLYLAKYFVDLHDGQLTVDSAPSEGTTFSVNLPLEG